jgi:hypothetical protein
VLKDAPLCLLPATGALIHAMCDQIDTDVLIANEAAAVTDIPDVHVSARWPASIAMRSPSICDIDAASFPPELSDVGMDVNRDVNSDVAAAGREAKPERNERHQTPPSAPSSKLTDSAVVGIARTIYTRDCDKFVVAMIRIGVPPLLPRLEICGAWSDAPRATTACEMSWEMDISYCCCKLATTDACY